MSTSIREIKTILEQTRTTIVGNAKKKILALLLQGAKRGSPTMRYRFITKELPFADEIMKDMEGVTFGELDRFEGCLITILQ